MNSGESVALRRKPGDIHRRFLGLIGCDVELRLGPVAEGPAKRQQILYPPDAIGESVLGHWPISTALNGCTRPGSSPGQGS